MILTTGATDAKMKYSSVKRTSILGSLIPLIVVVTVVSTTSAESPPVHYLWRADMPPGVVGQSQLLRAKRLGGYFQPVQIRGPSTARVAVAMDGVFVEPQRTPVTVGMQVGQVYRIQVSSIPNHEGFEVYPTVEVINRLHPPAGQEHRFPLPIDLTLEELELALSGKLVTRVIYLEPPDTALPHRADPKHQRYFEVRAQDDPLQVADQLGRPMAILRMGGIVPAEDSPSGEFLFHSPPVVYFEQSTP